ncbi:hypothetical protein H5V45_12580 [Nocardioides sp. KIGAM211]|uniref:Uncharacterized protein n=1 Tax=Nocardioides luti TaxID=2761101 RepID=A0A7X0RH89_9ACTN|nr:hypothetical protein [Nocardioides luti]MBB6628157.1 hypothetical protein [Nocardioides luti]
MGMRGLGAALVLALLGLAGGYAVGHLTRDQPTTLASAAPVPARNPSYPVDPEKPFAADIPYPPLQAGLDYRKVTLGEAPYEWAYQVPKGWKPTVENLDEIRWRPKGEPEIGGFSLRVKLSTEHKTREAMVAQKLAAMDAGYADVEVLGQTGDLLSFSYRDPTRNTQRFNSFRWFSIPGESEAKFEMSVVGRAVDQDGLEDLLEKVGNSVAKVQ